jgi:hypothetical protein
MRLSPLLCAIASAWVVGSSPAAFAEDPKPVTLPARQTWKAGDVVTTKSSESKTQRQAVKDAAGNPIPGQGGETTDKVEFELVTKVLEADAEGRLTKALVYFKAWSRTIDGKTDTSLTGRHAEITGAGKARAVALLGAAAEGPVAEWLDGELGKGKAENEEKSAVLLPSGPVTPGSSWDLPMAKVVASMGDGPMKFVAEKSTGKGTLVETTGDVARLKLEMRLQAGPVTTPLGPLPWKKGGVLEITAEGLKSLDASQHVEVGKMNSRFSGVAGSDAFDVEIDVTVENEQTEEPGGEIPEPEEAGEED